MNNLYEQQLTTFTLEKKEFDYDFVSLSFLSFFFFTLIIHKLKANSILNSYICGQLSNGIKFQIALTILDLCVNIGDKVLIFRLVFLFIFNSK